MLFSPSTTSWKQVLSPSGFWFVFVVSVAQSHSLPAELPALVLRQPLMKLQQLKPHFTSLDCASQQRLQPRDHVGSSSNCGTLQWGLQVLLNCQSGLRWYRGKLWILIISVPAVATLGGVWAESWLIHCQWIQLWLMSRMWLSLTYNHL